MLLRFIRNYWMSILVTIGILYLSFVKPSSLRNIPKIEHIDKLIHFCMYAFYAAVLIFNYLKSGTKNSTKTTFVLVCLVYPIVFSGWVEILQEYFFDSRTGDIFDWISNTLGVLFVWLLLFLFKIKRPV